MSTLRLAFLALLVALSILGTRAQDSWLLRSSGVENGLWGVAYGNNTWVAVGDPGVIITSPDGLTWTRRTTPFSARWHVSVTYANGLFVVTGGTPPTSESLGFLLTSPDGITWTSRINGSTRINQVTYGNGTWLAVDDLGGRWTSLDAITWSFGFTTRTGYLRGLAYGAPAFVTTGLSGVQSSYDGIAWVNRIPGAGQIEGLGYGRGRFVAVGTLGLAGVTYASRDGTTWTQQPTSIDLSARSILFFNNQFIVTGTAAAEGGGLATSFDGTVWSLRPTGVPTGTILLASAASPTSAVVVGTGGTILQSPASLNPPVIAAHPTQVIEAVGGNVAFTVSARGSLPLSYQWRKDGTAIVGATTDTYFLADVQGGQSGNYSCVLTNPAGIAISADAALIVTNPFPLVDPVDSTFTLGPSLNVTPRVAAAQSDGKIILGGAFLLLNQGQPQFGLARLNPDGSLDTTFKPGSINPSGSIGALSIQPDGKILIGGTFTSINGVARTNLARLNDDGSVDSSFNVRIPPFDPTQVAATRNGAVLATSAGILLRYLADGSSDATFTAGIAQQRFDQQPDGKIVIVTFSTSTTPRALVRLNPDGIPDLSFPPINLDSGGFTTPALRVLNDGRIMVAITNVGTTVQRFTSTGAFDVAVPLTLVPNNGGSTVTPFVTFLPDGRTWLAGQFSSVNGTARTQLARLAANLSVDPTFNPGPGTQASGGPIAPSFILPLDDGRAVTLGVTSVAGGTLVPRVTRLNAQSVGGANAPTIVDLSPRYRELRAGEPLIVPVTATGSALLSYSFLTPNGIGGAGFTGGLVPISAGLASVTGAYTITVANTSGAAASAQTFFVRIIPSAPFVTQNPVALQTNVGRPITLSATFGGSAGTTYQWFKNGTALSGSSALSNILSIARAAVTDSGDYTLVARNSLGFASSETVHVGVDETARFINLATRGNAGRTDTPLIVGFVAAGPGNKRVMLRAVGPTLGSFGVAGTLADPTLSVYNAAGSLIYSNDDWGQANDVPGIGTADTRLGAFQLNGGSADAAGILTLAPGAYTAVIRGKVVNGTETTGIALAEIYEDDVGSSRLTNLSSRGFVSPGASVMIPAFVTGTTTMPVSKKFLIRGVGPALTAFGVTGALANPTLSIIDSTGKTVATNDDWETNANLADLRAATSLLAFPLAGGSRDSALLVTLPPGAYTCVVSGVNNTSGTALVEVYEVP